MKKVYHLLGDLSKYAGGLHTVSDQIMNNVADDEYRFYKVDYLSLLSEYVSSKCGGIIHQHGIWDFHSFTGLVQPKRYIRIISPHGMLDAWALNHGKYKKKIALSSYEFWNFRKTYIFHALTENEKKQILNINPSADVVIIPNGISFEHSCIKKKDINSSIGENIFKILYFGRIDPKKSVYELVQSVYKIVSEKNIKNFKLDIIGWGDECYINKIKTYVNNADIIDYVHFHSPVFGLEKLNVMRKSDLLVLPSKSEGFPMVVLEAMSVKLPVAMTDECNISEAFNYRAAFRIDLDTLVDNLCDIMSLDFESRQDIGDSGYKYCKKYYSLDSVIKMYKNVYCDLFKKLNSDI